MNVTWQVMDDVSDDLVESIGHLTFDPDQNSAEFTLHVRDDIAPELDETYHVQLLHASVVRSRLKNFNVNTHFDIWVNCKVVPSIFEVIMFF